MKKMIAWLIIPFAVAASFDCGVPFSICALIEGIWIVSTLAGLECYKRKEEQKNKGDFLNVEKNLRRAKANNQNHADKKRCLCGI